MYLFEALSIIIDFNLAVSFFCSNASSKGVSLRRKSSSSFLFSIAASLFIFLK